MGFGTAPNPGGRRRRGGHSHPSPMSNFAAMSIPVSGRLSPVDKATSEIIDAFSNTNYAFWDVSVGFRIRFPLRFLSLRVLYSDLHSGYGYRVGGPALAGPAGRTSAALPRPGGGLSASVTRDPRKTTGFASVLGSGQEAVFIVPLERQRARGGLDRLQLRNVLRHRRTQLRELARRDQNAILQRSYRLVVGLDRAVEIRADCR